jgi:hypothetical protein
MADTIQTGTTLIEEGTLMPESLRFEGQPWTPFYMAGEIIRKLRKASGKQSKYGSEGNIAHSDKVIDSYNRAALLDSWWVGLFFNGSSSGNPAVGVVR